MEKENKNEIFYEGHISEVIYVEKPCRNRPALIGATLKCVLNVNGGEKEFYKFLPHSYSFKQSQLREYLVLIGLPMRNKKKTIKENLEGLPIMATLDMFQQIEKIQVRKGKRRKSNA